MGTLRGFIQTADRTKTVLTTYTGSYCVNDLDQQIERYAELLYEKHLTGKRVGLLLPHVFSFTALAMAVNQLGGIVVPLSWQYRSADLGEILKFLDLHIVFTVSAHGGFPYAEEIKSWARESEGETLVYQSDNGLDWMEFRYGSLEKNLEEASIDLICCTSGSTGLPKALMLNESSLVFTAQFAKLSYDLRADDRVLSMAPQTSVLGMAYLLVGLREGLHLVCPDTFDLPLTVKLAKEARANKILTSPSIMKAFFTFAKQLAPEALEHLEFCALGGEPVHAEISKQLPLKESCRLLGGYGCSEMGGTLICDLRGPIEWTVTGDVQYRISGEGELLLRTAGAFAGYYKQPDLTGEVWTSDGWFQTGDLVRENENGKLEIIGRKKDMIKKGGLQVIPGEVEKVLLQHPAVKQAVVLGAPHRVYGEQVVAFVVLQEEGLRQELFTFCADRIARFKVPDAIEVIPDIPIRQGKADKRMLRDMFLSKMKKG